MADGGWKRIAARGPVRAVAVGGVLGATRILSGGEDRKVRIWDPRSGELLQQLDGHTRAVRGVTDAVIDGRYVVVSCSEDRTIRVWDAASGNLVREFGGHSGRVDAIRRVVQPDGTTAIASASADGLVRVWDLQSGAQVCALAGHIGEAAALDAVLVLPSDAYLVSGGYDGSVRLWSTAEAKELRSFVGHTGAVWDVAFAPVPGEERVVSAGYDGSCRVWDMSTGEELRRLDADGAVVRTVEVLLGDERCDVVAGDEQGIVRIWDPSTGEEVRRLDHGARVRAVAVGRLAGAPVVVAGGDDGTVGLWDPGTGEALQRFAAHTSRASAVAATRVGQDDGIASAAETDGVRVWSTSTGAEVQGLHWPVPGVGSLSTSHPPEDGPVVVVAGGDVVLWDPLVDARSTLNLRDDAARPVRAHVAAVLPPASGPGVVAGGDGWTAVWRMGDVEPAHWFSHGGLAIHAITAVEIDGRTMVVAGRDDGSLWRCLPGAGEEIRPESIDHAGPVKALATATVDDRAVIVSAGADRTVRLWDPTSGTELARMTGHTDAVLALAVAPGPDGDLVVSAGADGTVRIWDVATGAPVRDPLFPHDGPVRGVAVSGELLASVGDDGMLVVQPLTAPPPTRPHTALLSDEPSAEDRIGSAGLLAQALADFLLDPETQPPITIGLKGPWGSGKTSVMLMIRDIVDSRGQMGRRRQIPLVRGSGKPSPVARLVARLSRRPTDLSAGEAWEESAYREAAPTRPRGLADDPQRVWRPSVWFNPWHHQSAQQVWAGLATSIVEEITGRMSRIDRERFFLRLNMTRVDPAAVRRTLHEMLWRRLALPMAGLVVAALFASAVASARWALGGFSLAALVTMTTALLSVARTPLERLYPALVANPAYRRAAGRGIDEAAGADAIRDPGHGTHLGYPYLAYVDLKRVIDLVATPKRPLVVFVDDLDRCSSAVVTQTLEALNLFLAGPFENCTFVMAVEPQVLAAHVAAAYEDLAKVTADDGRPGDELGWRFLEKMVQIPLVVPRPTREQASAFVTSLLPPIDQPAPLHHPADVHDHPPDATGEPQRRSSNEDDAGTTHRYRTVYRYQPRIMNIRGYVVQQVREPEPEPDTDQLDLARGREQLARSMASNPAFHDACVWAAQTLVPSLNPRQLKRMLAMIEVYALVANRLGYLDVHSPTALNHQLREIAVLAALNVRWPRIVDRLFAPSPDDPHGPLVVDTLRQSKPTGHDLDFDWIPPALKEFLVEHQHALDMASRLTTLHPATATSPASTARAGQPGSGGG